MSPEMAIWVIEATLLGIISSMGYHTRMMYKKMRGSELQLEVLLRSSNAAAEALQKLVVATTEMPKDGPERMPAIWGAALVPQMTRIEDGIRSILERLDTQESVK